MDLSTATPQQIEQFYASKGKDYYGKFTTNQLRNFFSEIVSLRTYYRTGNKDRTRLELRLRKLKSMLIYAEGKQSRSDLSSFRKDVFSLIDSVLDDKGDFNKKLELFFDIIEGMVAYHKFYEAEKKL